MKMGTLLKTLSPLMLMVGCAAVEESSDVGVTSSALTSSDVLTANQKAGRELFTKETFGGIGRTCGTCHTPGTGSITPKQVQNAFAENPSGPLFRGDGADSPGSGTFDRLRARATFRIDLPLPANVSIVGSSARSVTVMRAVPTTMNVPATDPVLMYDGRAPNLQEQARGAILGHAQSTAVTNGQLDQIADYEKTLFNNQQVKNFAAGGAVPILPAGSSDAEKRGRVWFVDDNPANGNPVTGRCVHCHAGHMLNEISPGFALLTGVPAGSRFFTAFVSEFNSGGLAPKTFRFTNPDNTTTDVVSADPGLALQTGIAQTAHLFKIPTLWGVKKTGPYFHDNSAADLQAMLNHYDAFFNVIGFDLTEQDKVDIAAYMQLL